MTSANPQSYNNHDRPIRIDRPLVLIGMMGVGKSTVGKLLASQMKLSFVDTDDEIEAAAGMTVSEIFERFGEAYFRDGERRVIARLIEGEPKVIATGGGAFVNEQTRALIKERCHSIWIDADLDILVSRVARRNHRPLLVGKDPRAVLQDLLEKRSELYALADFRVSSDTGPHSQTVKKIMKVLEACSK